MASLLNSDNTVNRESLGTFIPVLHEATGIHAIAIGQQLIERIVQDGNLRKNLRKRVSGICPFSLA